LRENAAGPNLDNPQKSLPTCGMGPKLPACFECSGAAIPDKITNGEVDGTCAKKTLLMRPLSRGQGILCSSVFDFLAVETVAVARQTCPVSTDLDIVQGGLIDRARVTPAVAKSDVSL